MEEDKEINLDSSGYLADNELKPDPLFADIIAKRKTANSSKSLSWIGEFCFQKGIPSYTF